MLLFYLHREFATRLFSFLRFTIAGHEIRTALWQALLPPGAIRSTKEVNTVTSSAGGIGSGIDDTVTQSVPIPAAHSSKKPVDSNKLNFEQLGRRFELNPGSIRSAIASAVSEAAMRSGDDCGGNPYDV